MMKSTSIFVSMIFVLGVACTSNRSESFSNLFEEKYKTVIVDLDTSFNQFLSTNYAGLDSKEQVIEFLEDVAMLTDTNWKVKEQTARRISNNYYDSELSKEFRYFKDNAESDMSGLYFKNLESCCSLNPAVNGYLEMYESENNVSQGILAASLNESISKMQFLSEGVRTIILFEIYLPMLMDRTTLPNNSQKANASDSVNLKRNASNKR